MKYILFEYFEDIFEHTIVLFESNVTRIIDKFNGKKFKIKMLLACINIWDILDGFKEPPPFNANPKVLKEYQRCVKKAMSIININLTDN